LTVENAHLAASRRTDEDQALVWLILALQPPLNLAHDIVGGYWIERGEE